MTMKRVLIGISVIIVLLVAGFFAYQQFVVPPPQEIVEVGPDDETFVDPNTISVSTELDTVTAEGQVMPLDYATLSFLSGGRLVEVLVAEGETVAAGAPLLRLDTGDQELAIIQAEAALAQANANLSTTNANLLAAQTGLQAAEVGVMAAEANLALLEAGPSAAQVALTEQSVAVAEAGIRQATGSRAAALEGATAAQIEAAEARLAAAQAQFLIAQRQFEPLAQNTDADEGQREQARLQLVAAQTNINAAQAALDELRAGPIAAEQTAANSGVAAATGQRDAAAAQLALLEAGTRAEQIAVAQTAVTEAQNRVVEAELRVVQAETAVTRAEAAITEAEVTLATAQTALERRTLTAPFAGTVAAIPVKTGQVLTAGFPALTLADFSRWQIETTDLSEISVVNIANGFTADITIDAFPGERLGGVVVDIASNSELVRGDVTYRVTLDLEENTSLPLRWGMTAFVSIDTRP